MGFLYKKRGVYYVRVSYRGQRLAQSTNTRNKKTAKALLPAIERELLVEILTGESPHQQSKKKQDVGFNTLCRKFLEADHGWSKSTFDIHKNNLKRYKEKGLPTTNYRAMIVRTLNQIYRWGHKEGLVSEAKHWSGGNKWSRRIRVFNEDELDIILNQFKPLEFQQFIRLMYYTGSRTSELLNLKPTQIKDDRIEIIGKTGLRTIKLTKQARDVLNEVENLWPYTRQWVIKHWRRNIKAHGIEDAIPYDLRRTFGWKLIKKGMPIFQVSKLLGHTSVTTTERHYAPLLATDVEDFEL